MACVTDACRDVLCVALAGAQLGAGTRLAFAAHPSSVLLAPQEINSGAPAVDVDRRRW